MMNQDQYHASLLGKKLDTEEVGWSGITRASRPKAMAPEPPNTTDPEQSIERIKRDDPELRRLNLNNVKTISEEQFGRLCEAASSNSRLEGLLCSNTHMGDTYAEKLVQLIESNPNIKEISIESNFISPPMIARLVKALLVHKSVETFRAANQRSQVLGNKIEMEITKYVEQNPNLLQFGLHFDFNDARARVCNQLQKNRDRLRELRHSGGIAPPADTTSLEDVMSSEPPNDYSIQLPATDSLPARAGGLRQPASDDRPDGLADDLAAKAVRVAADLSAGLGPIGADAEQVARDLTTVARDVDRVAEDVEQAVADVSRTVTDITKTAQDVEELEMRLERDFLDGERR
ncbi:Tropomodulin [Amphibalanus amphitrite]|uniref:Tropomodulin n=1 Tax=Amphibalanus amphitrite TaxID=1232801 RepID=A0A6A4X3H8_AMPAM|nr:Tropomodulin [Amphibalanus amphitrite]